MDTILNVTSNPHVREKTDTQKIMLCVIVALLPATLFGIYNFGFSALVLILVTIATCVFCEWAYEKLLHKKSTISDLSAVVNKSINSFLKHTFFVSYDNFRSTHFQ